MRTTRTRKMLSCLLLVCALLHSATFAEAFFTFSEPEATAATESAEPTATLNPEPSPTVAPRRFAQTNAAGVNVRRGPSAKAEKETSIPYIGTALEITGEETIDGVVWCAVLLDTGKEGYIRGDLLDDAPDAIFLTSANSAVSSNDAGATNGSTAKAQTTASTQTATATQKPSTPVGKMVWITATGSKYHSHANCGSTKNARQVALSEAQSKGLSACKTCY